MSGTSYRTKAGSWADRLPIRIDWTTRLQAKILGRTGEVRTSGPSSYREVPVAVRPRIGGLPAPPTRRPLLGAAGQFARHRSARGQMDDPRDPFPCPRHEAGKGMDHGDRPFP